MAKAITINVGDKKYILEFTRRTYLEINSKGLSLVGKTKITNDDAIVQFPLLFYGALLAHQPDITQEESDALLDKVEGKNSEFWEKLIELYAEPVNTLVDKDKKPKNKNWGANW